MIANFKDLISGSANELIWVAIADNRLDDAQNQINSLINPVKKSLFAFLKSSPPNPDRNILETTLCLLQKKPVRKFPQLQFHLKEEGDKRFAELVRFLLALHLNGDLTAEFKTVSDIAVDKLNSLSQQVRRMAGNYPQNVIAGYVWAGGASIRGWCEPLAELYYQTKDLHARANVLQYKCQITTSIMNHYPYTVGPDMIATAAALEAVGETELARQYYRAVISDFTRIAEGIQNNPGEGVREEDIISLKSLRGAHEPINRLESNSVPVSNLAFINSVIERGTTFVDEQEDDDNEK